MWSTLIPMVMQKDQFQLSNERYMAYSIIWDINYDRLLEVTRQIQEPAHKSIYNGYKDISVKVSSYIPTKQ